MTAAPWESDAVVSAPADKPWLADAPAKAATAAAAPSFGSQVLHTLGGEIDAAGSAIMNLPGNAINAVNDFGHRLFGDDSAQPLVGKFHTKAGDEFLGDVGGIAHDVASIPLPGDAAAQRGDPNEAATFGQNRVVNDLISGGVKVGGDVANIIPAASVAKEGVAALADTLKKPETIPEAAQSAANKAATAGNAGAAGTAVDTSKLTPETQAELARVGSSGGAPNVTALSRIHEAESLPVPVRLTAGQATGDAGTISEEFNIKGQEDNAIGKRYDEQDQTLKDNLLQLHREAAPDTVANNPIQNGQAIVDSLKRYDEPKVAEINAAYKAAKDANGGDLQMDGTGFASAADAALKPQGKGRFLPSSVRGIIDDVQESGGKMSLDDFEGYRTALANEARKAQISGDGNAVAAIGKVRDVLEDVQPLGASAEAKALYDKARGLAKARFSELDADPAYKAAVNDDAPIGEQSDLADKFADKYVFGGSKAALQRLRPKLDDEGSHAMTSSAMNFLQNKAGINLDSGAGKFSNAGYNAGLTKIAPKAQELLGDQDLIDNTRKLGNVANYTQALSRGSFANTSHTFIAEKAAEAGEHALNTAAHGIPIGTAARKFLAGRSSAARVREALKPGAGLED